MSGDRWKKYHEPRFLRSERKIIEEQLQIAISQINPKASSHRNEETNNGHWTLSGRRTVHDANRL